MVRRRECPDCKARWKTEELSSDHARALMRLEKAITTTLSKINL
jgi:transcriptional regulator NrdR family protein